MQTILALIVELALVAAAVSIIQALVLVFRNPNRPQWLRHGFAESVAVIGIVMGFTLTVATLISGLVSAGIGVFAALIVAAAVPFVVAIANARIFRIRERLRQAEAGVSPFAPLSAAARANA